MTDYVSILLKTNKGTIYRNLPAAELIEHAIRKSEGALAANGALVVNTGKYTGRSPEDKFIDNSENAQDVDWGKVNKPFPQAQFEQIFTRILAHLHDRDLYIYDGFAGACPEYRLPVRIITELAWHSLFVNRLLIRPTDEELETHVPQFTIVNASRFEAIPEIDGTRTETFIILDFEKRLGIIGGTQYAGENKKGVFTVLNYLLPHRDVFPMHCSANIGPGGDTALFFGLSGTGKTTLSADPDRNLIGDDEHGWSDNGIFNFEGGCYAKCINLTEKREPEIYRAVRYGSVLENVVLDPKTREPLYDDDSMTENTRAAYPLDFIPHAVIPSVGGHPRNIIFLTADAFGVLPPIARLTNEQAMYHFLSGYTSKLAGTERGVTEPQPTFSACFGDPFMPLSPVRYAELLGQKLKKHSASCYLLNTGWTGGPYGVGKRMDLSTTRRLLKAILDGELEHVEYTRERHFGLMIPRTAPDVPAEILEPCRTWADHDAYERAATSLAAKFVENFKRFKNIPTSIQNAGPE